MALKAAYEKQFDGRVTYNDGNFAELETVGVEGIEKDLLLDTMQVHRHLPDESAEAFRSRFPVGSSVANKEDHRVTGSGLK